MFISSNLFKCICLTYSNKWWWHAKLQPCFRFYNFDVHLCYLLVIIYDRFLLLALILSVLLIHLGAVLGLILLSGFVQVFALALWLQDHSGIWPLVLWIRITTYKAHVHLLPLPERRIWQIWPESITECQHSWIGNSSLLTKCILERSDM